MPNFMPKELIGHSTRGQVNSDSSIMFFLAIILIALGTFIILRGLSIVTIGQVDAPPSILIVIGVFFAKGGLLFAYAGAKSLFNNARRQRLQALYPHEPWRSDHAWNTQQAQDNTRSRACSTLASAAFLFLFLIPFNWWSFASQENDWALMFFVGLFDAILLLAIGYGCYLLFRSFKYGTSRLCFTQFPYFLGELFEAHLITDQPLGKFEKFHITLRCVQERIEIRGSGENQSEQIICYQLFSDVIASNRPGIQNDCAKLPITFALPLKPELTTRLLAQPPRLQYWEIDIAIETPGIDFGATFLVPIYARKSMNGRQPRLTSHSQLEP